MYFYNTFRGVNMTVILGVGNTLLKDEGIGIHLLDYIQKAYPQWEQQFDIQLIDGGTLSFDLLTLICSARKLIVLDAINLNQSPGKVYCLQDQAMDQFLSQPGKSVHEVSLQDLFDMSRLTEQLPQQRALIGIQPDTIDWGSELTCDVSQVIPEAAGKIEQLLAQWDVLVKNSVYKSKDENRQGNQVETQCST